jgi:hypothetical protein
MSIQEQDIDVTGILECLRSHMLAQPMVAKCGGCGGDLDIRSSIDFDLDMDLVVMPCTRCLDAQWGL